MIKKPKTIKKHWLAILFLISLAGIPIGIVPGIYIVTGNYVRKSKLQGIIMLFVAILMTIFWLYIKYFSS